MKHLPPIAGKRLVRPVARQRNSHVLARQLAYAPGRQSGCIRKRFVEHPRQSVQMVEPVCAHDAAAMLGFVPFRDLGRISAFVQPLGVEPDRAGANLFCIRLRHQSHDGRRIDAARQERAQRHVGHHSRGYPLPQMMQQFGGQVRFRSGMPFRKIDVPPLLRRVRLRSMLQYLKMPGGQFVHPAQYRSAVGYVTPCQIVFDRKRIDAAIQQRVGKQRFQLRCERDAAIAQPRREQRLHAQPVARQKQLPCAGIVNSESEHAIQP